jgi:hypothetical protein
MTDEDMIREIWERVKAAEPGSVVVLRRNPETDKPDVREVPAAMVEALRAATQWCAPPDDEPDDAA